MQLRLAHAGSVASRVCCEQTLHAQVLGREPGGEPLSSSALICIPSDTGFDSNAHALVPVRCRIAAVNKRVNIGFLFHEATAYQILLEDDFLTRVEHGSDVVLICSTSNVIVDLLVAVFVVVLGQVLIHDILDPGVVIKSARIVVE